MFIYKILLPSECVEFERVGRFDGSDFDLRSGFVHCSSRTQPRETAMRVFGEAPALDGVALDPRVLGDAVRWEPTPEGPEFPHVYASLPQVGGRRRTSHRRSGARRSTHSAGT